MLNLRLTLQVLLIFLTGTFLLIVGTPSLVGGLLFPLEREVQSLRLAVEGILSEKSTVAVNTISKNSVEPGILKYYAQKWRSENPPQDRKGYQQQVKYAPVKPDPELAKKVLEKGTKGIGRPHFSLAIDINGNILIQNGKAVGLPENIVGFPPARDALRGLTRDGLHVFNSKTILVGAAPVYLGKKIQGAVLQGWILGADFLDELSSKLSAETVFLINGRKIGASFGDVDLDLLPQAGTIKEFGRVTLDWPMPVELPLFVEHNEKYVGVTVPLFKNDMRALLVLGLDRTLAFETISSLQLAIVGSTIVLALMILLLSASLRNAWNKPVNQILSHLSAYQQQGIAAGILPESDMKGPYLRLAKQLNMILAQGGGGGGAGRSFSNPGMPAVSIGPKEASSENAAVNSSTASPPFDAENAQGQYPGYGAFESLTLDPKEEVSQDNATSVAAPTGAPQSALSALFHEDGDIPSAQAQSAPNASQTSGDAPNSPSTATYEVPEDLLNAASLDRTRDQEATQVTPMPNTNVPTEILDNFDATAASDPYDDMCQNVFQQFRNTREECGEDLSRLTFERFKKKLDKNRGTILERYKCKDVRFEVYVKAGKAAIRAIPVKG